MAIERSKCIYLPKQIVWQSLALDLLALVILLSCIDLDGDILYAKEKLDLNEFHLQFVSAGPKSYKLCHTIRILHILHHRSDLQVRLLSQMNLW